MAPVSASDNDLHIGRIGALEVLWMGCRMEFAVLVALGVIVVEVPALDVTVSYVAERHVALIREGLCKEDLERAADWLLGEATRASWTSPSSP